MIIKVLGSGCKRCTQLEDNVKISISELSLDASIEKLLIL